MFKCFVEHLGRNICETYNGNQVELSSLIQFRTKKATFLKRNKTHLLCPQLWKLNRMLRTADNSLEYENISINNSVCTEHTGLGISLKTHVDEIYDIELSSM